MSLCNFNLRLECLTLMLEYLIFTEKQESFCSLNLQIVGAQADWLICDGRIFAFLCLFSVHFAAAGSTDCTSGLTMKHKMQIEERAAAAEKAKAGPAAAALCSRHVAKSAARPEMALRHSSARPETGGLRSSVRKYSSTTNLSRGESPLQSRWARGALALTCYWSDVALLCLATPDFQGAAPPTPRRPSFHILKVGTYCAHAQPGVSTFQKSRTICHLILLNLIFFKARCALSHICTALVHTFEECAQFHSKESWWAQSHFYLRALRILQKGQNRK